MSSRLGCGAAGMTGALFRPLPGAVVGLPERPQLRRADRRRLASGSGVRRLASGRSRGRGGGLSRGGGCLPLVQPVAQWAVGEPVKEDHQRGGQQAPFDVSQRAVRPGAAQKAAQGVLALLGDRAQRDRCGERLLGGPGRRSEQLGEQLQLRVGERTARGPAG